MDMIQSEKVKTHAIHQLRLKFSFMINYAYIIVDTSSKEAAIIDPRLGT